ncbi:angiopoietin-1 receptor-like [Crassostrea angulata]|uniref:angiopoietin-1 receptor-like n=1 Tax=Magallana angulata TaxID=2784310 RepID=UPI0022B11B35|nr:angiopoietin-1 receptor-like [Crassostrea angulata]XP_052706968.1 angiopoietin-1 receptor-like [Crassostrea angulata]
MRYQLNVILLTLTSNVFTQQQSGVCSSDFTGSPLTCCKNYRLVGNVCTECFPGTYGVNCQKDCPPQFYGRFCRERCTCDPCDRIKGCLNILVTNGFNNDIGVS